jgi:hypothetical protein
MVAGAPAMAMNWEPVRATLTAAELMLVTRSIVGNGGHQRLLRDIVRTLDRRTNSILLTMPNLAQARTYATAYGTGGYQDRFKALVAAAERVRR